MNGFCLTIDTDWVCDSVLKDVIENVLQENLKITIFATNDSKYLKSIIYKYPENVEVGLHPNYMKFMENGLFNWKDELIKLKNIYPKAVGVRSHGHWVSSQLIDHYIDMGIKYESGIYIDNLPLNSILPYNEKFFRVSHFFQDDAHMLRNRPMSLESLNIHLPGIKVFDFHPIHIFLNSPDMSFYKRNKIHYHEYKILKTKVCKLPGINNLFRDLIEFLKNHKENVYLMRELLKS